MKKLIFPLLLILALALTGCGSDSSAPKATDTKTSLPPAAPTEKVDTQNSAQNSQKSNKKEPKYKFRDLDDSGSIHHFSK